jgi:hypothetical protein
VCIIVVSGDILNDSALLVKLRPDLDSSPYCTPANVPLLFQGETLRDGGNFFQDRDNGRIIFGANARNMIHETAGRNVFCPEGETVCSGGRAACRTGPRAMGVNGHAGRYASAPEKSLQRFQGGARVLLRHEMS